MEKACLRRFAWIAAILATMTLGYAGNADAALTVTVVKDTATELEVVWGWNPEGFNDLSTPTLANWNVSLNVSNLEIFGVPTILGSWTARHITDPHPGEEGGGGQVGSAFNFPSTNFGQVVFQSATTGHGSHFDAYQFTFDRSMDPANTEIRLIGLHIIPEPSSVALAGLGFVGLIGLVHRRRSRMLSLA